MQIPAGLTARPLELADAAAVTDVIAAQELHDVGEVMIEEADIVGDWQRPGYDVGSSDIGVFDGDRLVAYAEVRLRRPRGRRGAPRLPRPRPRHRSSRAGCRTRPARRASDGDRHAGAPGLARGPAPGGAGLPGALDQLGRSSCPRARRSRAPAAGRVRRARGHRGVEHEACWTVQEDAFLEWSERERDTFEEWRATTVLRPGFEPWNLRVVTDPSGDVVAMALIQFGLRARLHRPPRHPQGPARPRPGPGTARRLVPGGRPRTARRGPSSRPTLAPVRSASTRRSGCGSARPG